MAHDVFISYSSKDQKVVEGFSHYLEENGIRCWIAYRDIPIGSDWATYIPPAIKECRVMIYVHSENSNVSEEIDREIALCLRHNHPILPFRLAGCDYQGAKAYHLVSLNWIDAFPAPEQYFGKLLESTRALLGSGGFTPPPPPPVKKKNSKWIFTLVAGAILLGAALFFLFPENVEKGVKINGVTWATRNVGEPGKFVANPEDYGNYYSQDESQTVCPVGWRTPTREEFQLLINANNIWTSVNGNNGRLFGEGRNSIFLPATGRHVRFRDSGAGVDSYDQGRIGRYWSATPQEEYGGYYNLIIDNHEHYANSWAYVNQNPMKNGWNPTDFTVRCVRK